MRDNKVRAIRLRKAGKSYNEISGALGIPKSTLSSWFRDDITSQRIKTRLTIKSRRILSKNITRYNQQRSKDARAQWKVWQDKAKSEINTLSLYELKLVGTALYWAEGYKKSNWNIVFSNSDPTLIRIMVDFFRKVCKIDEYKIKGQVQIHPNISDRKAILYWSRISKIPTDRFRKSILQVPRSSQQKRRPRTLPYGTFRICINDVRLVNQIKGWMQGLN